MRKFNISAAVVLFSLLSFVSGAFAKTGPMPIRNQMPLYLFFLQMEPDKADVVETDKLDMRAYYTVSNITVSAFTPASSLYNINIDAEVSRVTLDLRYGIHENMEIGVEVPYLSLSRGYLDEFVEDFEDTVGATTPRSRERQGAYNLNYSFIYNNQSLINIRHSTEGLGDVVLKAKYQVIKEEDRDFLPNLSFRAAVKLPTGNENDLLGSGELDYGFGILLDKAFFGKIIVYAGCGLAIIEKPDFFSALNLKRNIVSGMLGAEYLFTSRFSLVAQIMANTSPYPSSGTNVLDEEGIDVGLGVNYTWKEKQDVSWHFGFTENINSASSPDVTFDTGFNIGF